ncbi:MAG: hypothetical protein JWR42_1232 [Marmoricola sp.]|nr:hypothetical protein [Marmoricola sp.]
MDRGGRPRGVRAPRLLLVPLLGSVLLGCGVVGEAASDDVCVSRYHGLEEAASWPALRTTVLASSEWGEVAAVRTQVRGVDVGVGDQDAVRVIDLLDRRGERLAQAEVWRTASGGWRAGVWGQCTD